ncbi:hypothetical protein [Bradyrhizobium sp. URHC0002]
MQDVIDQVMRTCGLMVTLAPEEEKAARMRLVSFLKDRREDARSLAVEG